MQLNRCRKHQIYILRMCNLLMHESECIPLLYTMAGLFLLTIVLSDISGTFTLNDCQWLGHWWFATCNLLCPQLLSRQFWCYFWMERLLFFDRRTGISSRWQWKQCRFWDWMDLLDIRIKKCNGGIWSFKGNLLFGENRRESMKLNGDFGVQSKFPDSPPQIQENSSQLKILERSSPIFRPSIANWSFEQLLALMKWPDNGWK